MIEPESALPESELPVEQPVVVELLLPVDELLSELADPALLLPVDEFAFAPPLAVPDVEVLFPAVEVDDVPLPPWALPALDPLLPFAPPTPGFWVRSTNWEPSAIGPDGLAGHDPGGDNAVFWPKGIVPCAPTATPPTKVLGLVL